jgi:hypothetical protein
MIWQPPNLGVPEQWSETSGDLGGPVSGPRYTVRGTSRISLLNVQEFLVGNQAAR